MANTENVDASPEPEPRVTNDVEGGKKQKEAVKRLSDYSREVMARKSRDVKPVEVEGAEEEPPKEVEVKESGWSISTGNAIAAVGVGVAILCLYLSYGGKKEKVSVPGPVTVKREPAKKAVVEPRFRKL